MDKSVQTDKFFEKENEESTSTLVKKRRKFWETGIRPITTYQINSAKCENEIKWLKYGIDRSMQTASQKKVANVGVVMKSKHFSRLNRWSEGCFIDGQYFK